MSKSLSPIQQWMIDHPDDTPAPVKSGGTPLRAWKRRRGLLHDATWEKYQAHMVEQRRASQP